VNMTQSAAKAEKIYRRFDAAVKKYIGLSTEYLGYVWMDESIRASVTLQRPVALLPELDPSCKSFYRLADSLDSAYSRGHVPNLSFTAYWEKVVERSAKKKADAAASAESNKPESSGENGRALSDHTIDVNKKQSALEAETNENVHPLHQSSEDQWIDLRVRLNQFLQNDDTTPEQVTTLLSSCIFSYGDQLGGAASDLLHGLLQVIDPTELSDEHRNLMIQNLERLRLVPNSSSKQPDITETPVVEDVKRSVVERLGPECSEPKQMTDSGIQKHRYDESEFGSQDRLVEKIRASKGKVSLEDLLESIKYASLVDS